MNTTVFIPFLLLMTVSFAHAEWAKENEFPFSIENTSDLVTVDKNGLSESTQDVEMKALNEEGRNKLVLQTIPIIPDAMTVKFIRASSITDGVESFVKAKDVTIRSAASNRQGLDHFQEMVIPFNNLKIGSITKYTVRIKNKKNLANGLFQQTYVFGINAPEKKGKALIRSALPLYVKVNDPWGVVQSKSYKERNQFVFEFEQTKPLFKIPKDPLAIIGNKDISMIQVSTMNNWNQFAKPLADKYENILKEKDLPPLMKQIAEKAKTASSLTEKIDIVTSELASVMTYSGDWTSFEKGFVPKKLGQISSLKTGDCKDFALSTTAILRSLGIQANVAIVKRSQPMSNSIEPISTELVDGSLFNHAIVKVTDNGKILWVDPTNMVSNAGYIFSDIAGAYALELTANTKELEKIPYPSPEESQAVFEKTINFSDDNTAETVTQFELSGEYSKYVLETSLAKNEDSGKSLLMTYLQTDPKTVKPFYEGIDFKSRKANKLKGVQKTVAEKILLKDKDQKSQLFLPPSRSILGLLLLTQQKRVTDANMISLYSEKTVTRVKGYDFVGFQEGCTILSPWFKVTRKIIKDGDGFKVYDNIKYKSIRLTAKEINSEKFQFTVGDVLGCFQDSKIEVRKIATADTLSVRLKDYTMESAKKEFELPGPKSVEGARHAYHILEQILDTTPDNKDALVLKSRAIRRVGYKRNDIDRSEYLNESEEILDALLAKTPKDPTLLKQKAWNSYYRKDVPEMKQRFSTAWSVSPKDYELFTLGGEVLKSSGEKDLALGSFLKAMNLAKTPAEKAETGQDIANILIGKGDLDRGFQYYKFAIKSNPEDTWIAGNFISIAESYNRWDDAIEVGEDLVKGKNTYGVAQSALANAYARKGRSFKHRNSETPEQRKKDLEQAEASFTKGLTHSADNLECLEGMAYVYYEKAIADRSALTAQKALNYIERAGNDRKGKPENFAEFKQPLELIAAGKPLDREPASIKIIYKNQNDE